MAIKKNPADWWWIGGGAAVAGTILGVTVLKARKTTPTSTSTTPTSRSSTPTSTTPTSTGTTSTASTTPSPGITTWQKASDGFILPQHGACPTGSVPLKDYRTGQWVCVPPCPQTGQVRFWNGTTWACGPKPVDNTLSIASPLGWYSGSNAISSATMQAQTLAKTYPGYSFYVAQYTSGGGSGALVTIVVNAKGFQDLTPSHYDNVTPTVLARYQT